jgi:hypothetical protein
MAADVTTAAVVVGSSQQAPVLASAGLTALLIGWLGPLGADVMMVVLSALAGCFIALTSINGLSTKKAIMFLCFSVLLSLVLSWAVTSFIGLSSPYAASMVALLIGYGTGTNRLSGILGGVLNKVEKNIEEKK